MTPEEEEILNLCLRYDDLDMENLKEIASMTNKNITEVNALLKSGLIKVYDVLKRLSMNNVTIRQLLINA